jgi:hypothetical protein
MQKYKKKLVAVLNGGGSIGEIMNALGHMSIGIGSGTKEKKELMMVDYIDGDGFSHKNLSELPFIILKAKKQQELVALRKKLLEKNINFIDYPNFLNLIGTFGDKEESKNFKKEDIGYLGIVIFDDWDIVTEMTKNFFLWK